MPIAASVGLNAVNRPADVRNVQGLLNEARAAKGQPPITVDGLVGPQTIGAIKAFQAGEGIVADGRVDPGRATITALESDGSDDAVSRAASILIAHLNQFDDLRSPDVPRTIRASLGRLRNSAASLVPVGSSSGSIGAQRVALGFVGGPGGRSPVIGGIALGIGAVLIILAMIAIIVAIGAMLADPKVQQALRNLGRIPQEISRLISEATQELQTLIITLIVEISDLARRFDRCFEKLITRSPQCAAAIGVFGSLQAQVTAKQAQMTALILKIEADNQAGTPNPADVTRLGTLATELKDLVTRLERALEDVLTKCNCRDE
jgi:peptidoglycan hydrolase-like protein with peptidoglycan-binding domain/HAMP domain-containing protein